GTVCVVGKIRDLILQLSKSSIYSTKPYFSANSSPQDLGVQSVADRANLGSITSFFASNPH
ncbi:hypothetical protein P2Q56_19890, partial [Escherichia coli]